MGNNIQHTIRSSEQLINIIQQIIMIRMHLRLLTIFALLCFCLSIVQVGLLVSSEQESLPYVVVFSIVRLLFLLWFLFLSINDNQVIIPLSNNLMALVALFYWTLSAILSIWFWSACFLTDCLNLRVTEFTFFGDSAIVLIILVVAVYFVAGRKSIQVTPLDTPVRRVSIPSITINNVSNKV